MEITDLLNSTNVEDIFLGIELLYREDPNSEYFDHYHENNKKYLDRYGSYGLVPWSLYEYTKKQDWIQVT